MKQYLSQIIKDKFKHDRKNNVHRTALNKQQFVMTVYNIAAYVIHI